MKGIITTFFTQDRQFTPLEIDYKVQKKYVDCKKLLDTRLYGPTGSSKKQLTTN